MVLKQQGKKKGAAMGLLCHEGTCSLEERKQDASMTMMCRRALALVAKPVVLVMGCNN